MAKNFFNKIAKMILDALNIPTQKIMHAEYTSRNLPPPTSLDGDIKDSFLRSVQDVISYDHIFLCKDLSKIIESKREELNLNNSNPTTDPSEFRERRQYSSLAKQCRSLNQHLESFEKQAITLCLFYFFADAYWIAKVEKERKKLLNKTIHSKRVQPSIELNTQEKNLNNDWGNEIECPKDDNNYQIAISDPAVFKKEFKIGILLSKLKFYSFDQDEHSKTLELLLSTPIYNALFNNGDFDFTNIRFDFFFKRDLPFSCIAGIGYICGYYVYEHHLQNCDTPILSNDNLKRKFLVRLDNFACIKDTTSFLYLLNEICELSEESQCENILRFINPNIYDNDNTLHTTVRMVAENGVFNCNSITDALQYLITTKKYARITSNTQIIEACNWIIDKIKDDTFDDDYFQDRKKCMVWASNSLWDDVDYFENLCMDLIEAITISNNTRNNAIKSAKQFLSTAKKGLIKERDIQIYERVLLEFNIATDEEYSELRDTLKD